MQVKARCREMRWPLLEEYDFRHDAANPDLPIELKPDSAIRDYQEQALKRVFGNHRARSGIIVLPCGAGKTLVGIVAACTVKKSTLVLCNNSVAVEQWYAQFLMWANLATDRISRFTAGKKEPLHAEACVLISTYNMIGYRARPPTPSSSAPRQPPTSAPEGGHVCAPPPSLSSAPALLPPAAPIAGTLAAARRRRAP
jgi:superfamily II DNA or RNA helicase